MLKEEARADSAGRMRIELPALLPGFCLVPGVASGLGPGLTSNRPDAAWVVLIPSSAGSRS